MTGRRPDAYYEELEARLRALNPLVDRLGDKTLAAWYREFLDVGGYWLAVEVVAEQLPPDCGPSHVRDLAAGLLPEAEVMGLDDPVVARLEKLADRRA